MEMRPYSRRAGMKAYGMVAAMAAMAGCGPLPAFDDRPRWWHPRGAGKPSEPGRSPYRNRRGEGSQGGAGGRGGKRRR